MVLLLNLLGILKANPGSIILSAELMLRHLGWNEAADLIIEGMEKTISSRKVTHDFAALMENSYELNTNEFGDELIANINA